MAIRVCPCVSFSTHRMSVTVHQTSVAVRVFPCVSVSTHRTSVAVYQYTYQHAGPWTHHTGPSRGLFGKHRTSVAVCVCLLAHTGRPWLSIRTHISTLVLGLSTLTVPVDWSGDFSPRGLSVQYTQDVRGCPPAHTGQPLLSVCVHVCLSAHTGRPWLSISTHIRTLALPVDCSVILAYVGCLFSTHRTSICVHQQTHDIRVCPSAHTRRLRLFVNTHRTSVAARVCPSAHTRHLWLSISTHISTLVLGLSTLTLPVDCSVDFGPHGLSIQYTQDVRGCPPAHRMFVAIHVCLSVDTRRLWLSISTHISTLVLGLSTLAFPVDCSGDFGPCGLSVQYTQDVCVCSSAHTGCPCVSVSTHRTSVAVRKHKQDVLGCPCVTLALPVDCLGDFGPRGLSVQYTQDVRGCPPAHTERPWLSVAVRQHTQDVRGCPCVSISTHMTSVAVHQYTYQHAGPWTPHTGPSRGLFGTHRTSVAVRVCPCVSVSTHMTSVAVHQYTYQHVVIEPK
ncbi:hypothetical protein YC2023_066057 [Brassica napus]